MADCHGPVVLPHEEDVEAGQEGLLVHPEVTGHKVLSVVWTRRVMILKRHNKGGWSVYKVVACVDCVVSDRKGWLMIPSPVSGPVTAWLGLCLA